MTRWKFALLLLVSSILLGQKAHVVERLGDGDLILVRTMVRFTTLIVLPEGERISEVTCGDSSYWSIEGKEANVHVKPAKEGATTNLNVVSKSGVVYSFLLQEVSGSKAKPSKTKPDLIVHVDPAEVSQLRKENDGLTELLSRAERELKEQRERAEKALEAERKRLKRKEEEQVQQAPQKPSETPKVDAPTTSPVKPGIEQQNQLQSQPASTASDPELVARVYHVENDGILTTAGRTVGRALRKMGRFLHLF